MKARRSEPSSQIEVGFASAREVEMKPVDPWIEGLDLQLARNAVELATAADDVQTVVASSHVAANSDVTGAGELPVQVGDRVALEVVGLDVELALTPVPTDAVLAVLGVEELVLEAELGVTHSLARGLLREDVEVVVERGGGGSEQTRPQHGDDHAQQKLVHMGDLSWLVVSLLDTGLADPSRLGWHVNSEVRF